MKINENTKDILVILFWMLISALGIYLLFFKDNDKEAHFSESQEKEILKHFYNQTQNINNYSELLAQKYSLNDTLCKRIIQVFIDSILQIESESKPIPPLKTTKLINSLSSTTNVGKSVIAEVFSDFVLLRKSEPKSKLLLERYLSDAKKIELIANRNNVSDTVCKIILALYFQEIGFVIIDTETRKVYSIIDSINVQVNKVKSFINRSSTYEDVDRRTVAKILFDFLVSDEKSEKE